MLVNFITVINMNAHFFIVGNSCLVMCVKMIVYNNEVPKLVENVSIVTKVTRPGY